MPPISVKISSNHRIVVPPEIRKELGLQAGDHLLARVRDGVIVLVPRRGDAVDQLGGLHGDVWEGDVDAYLDAEREAWGQPIPS